MPELGDAIENRELVVFGESRINYYSDSGNWICRISTDIEGWAEQELIRLMLAALGAARTTGFTNDDSTCDHSIGGAATIALTPISTSDTQPSWQWDILTEEDPSECRGVDGAPLGLHQHQLVTPWVFGLGATDGLLRRCR